MRIRDEIQADGGERCRVSVRVPDWGHQMVLFLVARAHGLRAAVPGKAKTQVLLFGTESEIHEVVRAASRVGRELDELRVQVFGLVLKKNGLPLPHKLAAAPSQIGCSS